MVEAPEELERQLDAGVWLTPTQVAELLDISRSTVWRMWQGDSPAFRSRIRAGRGGYRELHPDDVRAALAERRKVHG